MTTISGSATINQTDIDGYTFPVTITGGTSGSPVVITFFEDLTISSINGYFIIGSQYITINGQSHTVTITDTLTYPGLIENGTSSSTANTNVILENIGVLSSGTTTLENEGGWLCQTYFGRNISTGTLTIQNCYSTGIISGNNSGGICGAAYGSSASGDAELIIQNCYSNGIISGTSSGGICGVTYGSSASGGTFTIQNCYSNGTINGNQSGGICGAFY